MAQWRIQALAYGAPQVLEAALAAAANLGFGITQVDSSGGHLLLTLARPFGMPSWPVEAAVIDSGLGSTSLRVSWDAPATLPWLPPSPRRRVGRLQRLTDAYLQSGEFD